MSEQFFDEADKKRIADIKGRAIDDINMAKRRIKKEYILARIEQTNLNDHLELKQLLRDIVDFIKI